MVQFPRSRDVLVQCASYLGSLQDLFLDWAETSPYEELPSWEPRRGDWIQSYTGKRIYPFDPRQEDICVEDIAHSLSLECRFTGHVSRHYSVGEHTLLMLANLDKELQFSDLSMDLKRRLRRSVLFHDAPEYALRDLPRPLKRMKEFRFYRRLERRWSDVIGRKFSAHLMHHPVIKGHDERALMTERRDLVPGAIMTGWTGKIAKPYPERISPVAPHPKEVEERFLLAFQSMR